MSSTGCKRPWRENFSIAIAGMLEPVGRHAIAHVCHSSDLACRAMEIILNNRPGGRQISNHFGVHVELTLRPQQEEKQCLVNGSTML